MDEQEEQKIDRRVKDTIRTWASILGPLIGMAFGAGIIKASTQGQLDKIPKLEARIESLETNAMNDRVDIQVTAAKFTEQISAINNRMGRMEDLLEKTFYSVSELPKKR